MRQFHWWFFLCLNELGNEGRKFHATGVRVYHFERQFSSQLEEFSKNEKGIARLRLRSDFLISLWSLMRIL